MGLLEKGQHSVNDGEAEADDDGQDTLTQNTRNPRAGEA